MNENNISCLVERDEKREIGTDDLRGEKIEEN